MKGKVINILEELKGTSAKGEWCKRGFVIETMDQYPKKVQFDVFKTDLQMPQIEQVVDVSYNAESREYNGRWYTNLTAWKIEFEKLPEKQQKSNGETQPTNDLPF